MSLGIFWPLATVDGIAFYFLASSWWTDPCPYCADAVDAKNVYISWFQLSARWTGKGICSMSGANQRTDVEYQHTPQLSHFQIDCKMHKRWLHVGEHGSKERRQETCSFLLLECPNGCHGSHLRDSLERHLEICPQKKVPCEHCTAKVERHMLDQHEPTCQEKPRPCPLNCGHNLPRSVIIQLSPWIDSWNFVIILVKKREWKKINQ